MHKQAELRKHYPELQESLTDCSECDKQMGLTTMINQTSKLAKRCLNPTYVNGFSKLIWMSIRKKLYTWGTILEAKL